MHKEISSELAIELLSFVFGFKHADKNMKSKLKLWSDRSADTGQKYDFEENANYYLEAHQFFLKTINEVEQDLAQNR